MEIISLRKLDLDRVELFYKDKNENKKKLYKITDKELTILLDESIQIKKKKIEKIKNKFDSEIKHNNLKIEIIINVFALPALFFGLKYFPNIPSIICLISFFLLEIIGIILLSKNNVKLYLNEEEKDNYDLLYSDLNNYIKIKNFINKQLTNNNKKTNNKNYDILNKKRMEEVEQSRIDRLTSNELNKLNEIVDLRVKDNSKNKETIKQETFEEYLKRKKSDLEDKDILDDMKKNSL